MARHFIVNLMSINVKLLLWFWLITLVSVIATGFVTHQLYRPDLHAPLYKEDAKMLTQISMQLINAKPKKIKHFFMFAPRRWGNGIVIKDTHSNEIISNQRKGISPFAKYIAEHDFDNEMMTIRVDEGRITGPKLVSMNQVNYQIFFTDRTPPPSIDRLFFRLPTWLKILIPLIISFIFCWFLARTLTKPLHRIQDAATHLGDGDLSVRVEETSERSDELGGLAKSFNHMAAKLQTSLTAQQRLIADVSHELRSPMTRLQLAIGLAQKSSQNEQNLQKYLIRCETEIERLEQMIGSILSFSRLENSLYALNLEPIEIKTLMALIIQDAQFVADEKNININFNSNADGELNGDGLLLSSAINNVLTNAIKYSPKNSEIKCLVQQDKDRLMIVVSDAGPGVPEQCIGHLFEPFYRVADARDRKTGGTGLGLAITKQAIAAHQGEISAKNNHDKGLTVSIELPLTI